MLFLLLPSEKSNDNDKSIRQKKWQDKTCPTRKRYAAGPGTNYPARKG
jgi:hypothetical protein